MFPFLKLAALENTVDYKRPANTHAAVSPYRPRVNYLTMRDEQISTERGTD